MIEFKSKNNIDDTTTYSEYNSDAYKIFVTKSENFTRILVETTKYLYPDINIELEPLSITLSYDNMIISEKNSERFKTNYTNASDFAFNELAKFIKKEVLQNGI